MAAKILKNTASDKYHISTLKLTTSVLFSFAAFDEIGKITVEHGKFLCISSCFYIYYCEISCLVRPENELFVGSATYFVVHALWL